MGELILCRTSLAGMPYFIEEASLNIYSLEELCYYIGRSLDRIDDSFWCEELFSWLGLELHREDLAEELRTKKRQEGGNVTLVGCMFAACGFFSQKEKQELLEQLAELENKTEFEKKKLQADRYLKNKRYAASIEAYQSLLIYAKDEPLNTLELGSIWHNMGVANAQMFLYEQAAECFKKAYEYNNQPESLMEMYFALQCVSPKDPNGDYTVPEEWHESVMERLQRAVDEIEKEAQPTDSVSNTQQITEWMRQYRLYSRL